MIPYYDSAPISFYLSADFTTPPSFLTLPPQMDAFPVLPLHRHLLEKIITRTEWRSYFRLQQTCKDMEVLIQTSRNITVHMANDDHPHLQVTTTDDMKPKYFISCGAQRKPFDFRSLYGIRLREIFFRQQCFPPRPVDENFLTESIDILKKYNITSNRINGLVLKNFPNEQYEKLLKQLKPIDIHLDSCGSSRMELLLAAKQLMKAVITVNITDVEMIDLFLTRKFLYKLQNVVLNVMNGEVDEYIALMKRIMEFLQSETLPNIRILSFGGVTRREYEFARMCNEFYPTPPKQPENQPAHLFYCTMEIQVDGMKHFHRLDVRDDGAAVESCSRVPINRSLRAVF